MRGLYAIADAQLLRARGLGLLEFAQSLRAAGVQWLQYRDKQGSPQEVLRGAAVLRQVFPPSHGVTLSGTEHEEPGYRLILNNRADLAVLAQFDGVHVGQDDLSPANALAVMGSSHIVGVSTHSEQQVRAAQLSGADYVAIGPVFATATKLDAEAAVELDGVRRARALTSKPLVAIGGITRSNARSVIEAGADAVAVISGLFAPGESVEKVARDFLELLR